MNGNKLENSQQTFVDVTLVLDASFIETNILLNTLKIHASTSQAFLFDLLHFRLYILPHVFPQITYGVRHVTRRNAQQDRDETLHQVHFVILGVQAFDSLTEQDEVAGHSCTDTTLRYRSSRMFQRGENSFTVFYWAENFNTHHANYTYEVVQSCKKKSSEMK